MEMTHILGYNINHLKEIKDVKITYPNGNYTVFSNVRNMIYEDSENVLKEMNCIENRVEFY